MKTATPRTSADIPFAFALRIAVRTDPDANTGLYGLCRSRDGYFTRSKAQGFHRTTCLLDRPNVMSTCTVRRAPAIS